jgi:dihydroxyacetone kinase-like predicted kinase
MDGADLASAMKMSTETAYSAVMKPSEGTILTVSRVAAAKAEEAAAKDPSFEYVLEQALQAAQRALPETMNQNSVLKKAGVVDAGAVGYVIMLQAALGALRGESRHEISQPRDKADFSAINEEEITFTYCTEFIVEKNGLQDTTDLKTFLSERGDSIVLVDDEDIIKVHIHTDDPGDVLHEALRYGAFSMVKVENMRLQHTEKIESSMAQEEPAPPEKELGFVAVCSGEGMCAAFREIGVDCIVEGGQTMNPSTQDILRAIESIGLHPAQQQKHNPHSSAVHTPFQQRRACHPVSHCSGRYFRHDRREPRRFGRRGRGGNEQRCQICSHDGDNICRA